MRWVEKLSQILPCPFYFDYRCCSIFLSASLVRMYERKRKVRALVSFSCGLAAAWGIWKLGTTCVVAKLVHLSHSCFDIHLLPVIFRSIASTIAPLFCDSFREPLLLSVVCADTELLDVSDFILLDCEVRPSSLNLDWSDVARRT